MVRYEWFSNSFLASGGSVALTYLGIQDQDDHNGEKACQDGDWLANGYSTWVGDGGSGFGDDPVSNLCYSGFKRNGADNGQTAADCISDAGKDGNDFVKDGSGGTAAKAFIRNVNKQFYGKDSTALPPMTPAMRYYMASQSFITLCKAKVVTGSAVTLVPPGHLYTMTDENGKEQKYQADKSQNDPVVIGATDSLGKNKASCASLVKTANDNSAAFQTYKQDHADTATASANDGSVDDVDVSCGD